MKKPHYIMLFIGLLNLSMAPVSIIGNQSTACDIDDVLEAQSLPANSYAVTGYGDYEEASEVIIPISLDDGTYSESVSRKGGNLYKVDGVNLFIKTSMCYEYAYSQDAIIEITNYGGYTLGELTFK